MTLGQLVYDEFRKVAAWPQMNIVDRAFIKTKRHAIGAATLVRGLPDGLLMGTLFPAEERGARLAATP